jgi:hypothetical protein
MADFQLTTPVAFLIFNRPDTTARVFEAIRQAKPPKLLVVADGPRPDRPDDVENCKAARAIIDGVDWDCEVLKNYSDINLGCGKRPATGITWVFEQVEEAIILEDDCMPNPTFFEFCQAMLAEYRDDKRIMMISGTNFLGEWKSKIQSYHFSFYGGTWGWASWRRAWQYFDYEIKLFTNSEIRELLASDELFRSREKIYCKTNQAPDLITWWDYQWCFARLVQSGLSIVPSVNLISNIGFGDNATHTKNKNSAVGNIPLTLMSFPLREPSAVIVDREYDNQLFNKFLKSNGLSKRIIGKIYNTLRLLTNINKSQQKAIKLF